MYLMKIKLKLKDPVKVKYSFLIHLECNFDEFFFNKINI